RGSSVGHRRPEGPRSIGLTLSNNIRIEKARLLQPGFFLWLTILNVRLSGARCAFSAFDPGSFRNDQIAEYIKERVLREPHALIINQDFRIGGFWVCY